MRGSMDAFPPRSELIDQRFAVDGFFLLASSAVSDECRDVSSRLRCLSPNFLAFRDNSDKSVSHVNPSSKHQ